MSYYIDSSGNYYEGDKYHPDDILVTVRPSPNHSFKNGMWVLTVASQNAEIQRQIELLERQVMIPRVVREFMIAQAVITAQAGGVDEPTLYAQNIGYRKLKDLDNQIFSLRQQIIP